MHAINIIAWISMVAILFGTAAMIVVLSVFNGFEGLVKSLYSSFYTDLRLAPKAGKVLTVTPAQLERMRGNGGIRNFSLVAEEKGLLQNGDYQSVVYIKGVDAQYRYTAGVAEHLVGGAYDLGTTRDPKLLLGAGVEAALGLAADRRLYRLTLYLPRRNRREQINLLDDISSDTIRSSGAFLIQQEFDNKYAITDIGFVRRALNMGPADCSAVEIALRNPTETEQVRSELRKIFGDAVLIQDRYQQNRSLYTVMKAERWAIYGIFCLIMVVAAFNMIGALTMLVLEKRKDISVLQALGANRRFLLRIFLSEGMVLAGIGGAAGMLLALLLAWLQTTFHLVPLGGSFLIRYFPVELRLADFLLIGVTVFGVAFAASWLPARKASRQAFSLRSE